MLFSSGLSAGVNFIGSIVVTKLLSFEIFGLWLSLRSFVQLTNIFNLGISNYLLLKLTPPFQEQRLLINQINTIALFLTGLFALILSGGYFIYYHNTKYLGLFVPFLTFGICLVLSGISSLNSRALRDGKKIFIGNLIDVGIGVVCLIFICFVPNISYFIYFQSFRFLIKFIYQFDFSTYQVSFVTIKKLFHFVEISFPVHFRSWIQSMAQYGDKLILPLAFGFTLAGAIGFGSTLALPVIMVISVSSVLLIPKTIDNKEDSLVLADIYKKEVIQVLNLAIVLSLFIPLFTEALNLDNRLEIIIGFWIAVLINLSQFISLWFFKDVKTTKSAFILILLISIFFLLIFMSSFLSAHFSSLFIYNILIVIFIFISFSSFRLIIFTNLARNFISVLISVIVTEILFFLNLDFSLLICATLIINSTLIWLLYKAHIVRLIVFFKNSF